MPRRPGTFEATHHIILREGKRRRRHWRRRCSVFSCRVLGVVSYRIFQLSLARLLSSSPPLRSYQTFSNPISTMMRLLLSALTLAFARAATRVAVIEVGQAGIVRRTNAVNEKTTVEGVASFWSALHGHGRKLQHSGMTVVPDLFGRPDDGIVVAMSGVDMESMPSVSALMTEEGANGVVGHMEVRGTQCSEMMKRLQTVEMVDASSLVAAAKKHAEESGLSGLKMEVTSENARDVDAQVDTLLESMRRLAIDSGKNIVLHVVVEEEQGAARRRRLNDEEEGEGEGDNEDGDNADGDNADGGGQQFSGYYGYGYYNAYGEWVTPYKTMFQIQYFNVVLWTAVALFFGTFYAIYLMINMPLMPDTLLFGESAQMATSD